MKGDVLVRPERRSVFGVASDIFWLAGGRWRCVGWWSLEMFWFKVLGDVSSYKFMSS